jgi:dethiobiotin synthetase
VPVLGVAFVGDGNEDSEATIAAMGQVRRLGRLPRLAELTAQTVGAAFATHFRIEDFR